MNRDSSGRPENIAFSRYAPGDNPLFTYGLQISSDLVAWEDIPSIETIVYDDKVQSLQHVTLRPPPDIQRPAGACFLRLVVSTDFYIPKPSEF